MRCATVVLQVLQPTATRLRRLLEMVAPGLRQGAAMGGAQQQQQQQQLLHEQGQGLLAWQSSWQAQQQQLASALGKLLRHEVREWVGRRSRLRDILVVE